MSNKQHKVSIELELDTRELNQLSVNSVERLLNTMLDIIDRNKLLRKDMDAGTVQLDILELKPLIDKLWSLARNAAFHIER